MNINKVSSIQSARLAVLETIKKIKQDNRNNKQVEIDINSLKLSFAIQAEKSIKSRLVHHLTDFKSSFLTELAATILKNDSIDIQDRVELAYKLESLSELKSNSSRRAAYYDDVKRKLKKQKEALETALISKYCCKLSESQSDKFVWISDNNNYDNLSTDSNADHGKIVLYILKNPAHCEGFYLDPFSGEKQKFKLSYPDFKANLEAHQKKLTQALAVAKEEEAQLGVIVGDLPLCLKPGQLVIQKKALDGMKYQIGRLDQNHQLQPVDQDGYIKQGGTSTYNGLTNLKKRVLPLLVEELKKQYPSLVNLIKDPTLELPKDTLGIKLVNGKCLLVQNSSSLRSTLSVEMATISSTSLQAAKTHLKQLLSVGLTTSVSSSFLKQLDSSSENEILSIPENKQDSDAQLKIVEILVHQLLAGHNESQPIKGAAQDVIANSHYIVSFIQEKLNTHISNHIGWVEIIRNAMHKVVKDQALSDANFSDLLASHKMKKNELIKNLRQEPELSTEEQLFLDEFSKGNQVQEGFFEVSIDETGKEKQKLTIKGTEALLRQLGILVENPNLKELRNQKMYWGKMPIEQVNNLLRSAKNKSWILSENPEVEGQLILSQKKKDGVIHKNISPESILNVSREKLNINDSLSPSPSALNLLFLESKDYFWGPRLSKTAEEILVESSNPAAWLLRLDQTGKLILSRKNDEEILHMDISAEFSLDKIENKYGKANALNSPITLAKLKSKPYYWGAISSEEVRDILLQAEEENWMIRYSENQDRFVISQRKGDKVQHTLLKPEWTLESIEAENGKLGFGISKALYS